MFFNMSFQLRKASLSYVSQEKKYSTLSNDTTHLLLIDLCALFPKKKKQNPLLFANLSSCLCTKCIQLLNPLPCLTITIYMHTHCPKQDKNG